MEVDRAAGDGRAFSLHGALPVLILQHVRNLYFKMSLESDSAFHARQLFAQGECDFVKKPMDAVVARLSSSEPEKAQLAY